ncbi:MAG: metal-sensitive transcriptional regulator [Aquimonas sp.]|nr:metal-sensitive transcriptional regulator [Aquimonas sp.]
MSSRSKNRDVAHDASTLEAHQRAIALRLKRAEGQIRGVLRMMENGDSCNDIAQQLAAARNALDRAFFEMMACSIESEIMTTPSDLEKHERVSEILKVLSKYA